MGRLQARLRVRGVAFAIGLVAGVTLALAFLVWAVPEFRSPAGAKQYYQQWQAAAQAPQENQPPDSHFWIREFYGWAYAEDSLAQWLMAILGFAATAISLYALIWLRRTWDQARRSADAAFAAVDAAIEANDAAREISRRELRAYVFPAVAKITGTNTLKPIVGVVFKNTGLTPAYRVSLRWRVDLKANTDDFALGTALPVRYPNIGPGLECSANREISADKWADALNGMGSPQYDFVAYGRISYVDAFGIFRWTDFRLKVDKRLPIEDGELLFCNGGNDSDQETDE